MQSHDQEHKIELFCFAELQSFVWENRDCTCRNTQSAFWDTNSHKISRSCLRSSTIRSVYSQPDSGKLRRVSQIRHSSILYTQHLFIFLFLVSSMSSHFFDLPSDAAGHRQVAVRLWLVWQCTRVFVPRIRPIASWVYADDDSRAVAGNLFVCWQFVSAPLSAGVCVWECILRMIPEPWHVMCVCVCRLCVSASASVCVWERGYDLVDSRAVARDECVCVTIFCVCACVWVCVCVCVCCICVVFVGECMPMPIAEPW